MRSAVAALGLVLVGSLAFAPAMSAAPAPTTAVQNAAATGIEAQTIVVLRPDVADVADAARDLLAPYGVAPFHIYTTALKGFAVDLDVATLAALQDDQRVAYLEADREAFLAAQTTPRGVSRVDAPTAASIGDGSSVSVDIAIIDTGIASHSDLNVVQRRDCADTDLEVTLEYVEYLAFGDCKTGGSDSDGHGTAVAGVAAARDNTSGVVGVAPGARLWAIKVDRNGKIAFSDLIRGVEEVARNASSIEVANISIVANGTSSAINDAIAGATKAGVVVVVAAGNDSKAASGVTPANAPDAITVGAITDLDGKAKGRRSGSCYGGDDTFATYSNHGSVLDIVAPGSCIETTARNGALEFRTGTSMAAPHVAGAAALRIAQTNRSASSSRSQAILTDLLSTSAAEGTSCGYAATSLTNARLLDLVAGC